MRSLPNAMVRPAVHQRGPGRVGLPAPSERDPGKGQTVSASDHQDAERARLHEIMTVSAAESTVAGARMAELKAAQDRAWRRYNAAKGLLTRARKDGSAEKIAAA